MTRLEKLLLPLPVFLAFNLFLPLTAIASEDEIEDMINHWSSENIVTERKVAQTTSVSQLKDVSPTDWAYKALQSLVERYGCIAGYPNSTYRGNRAISRYEFAAGLNACLSQIERLIQQNEAVSRQDLETINRLAQDYQTELATLGSKVSSST
jgi:S-layer homology domain